MKKPSKPKVMMLGVWSLGHDWWWLRTKRPHKVDSKTAALLDDAFREGVRYGISRATFRLEELYRDEKDR